MWEDAGSSIAILIDKRTGQEYNIRRYATSVGREMGNDLIMNADKTISRQHALIQYLDGSFHVSDLGSKNGTKVNGVKVNETTRINSGDEISFGLSRLIFLLLPQERVDLASFNGARTETVVDPVSQGAAAC
ncbi:MAG: FHA domain-containing protein [Candidatus Obscuribacterales bacterium]|nr:FHA domain-containing protein [Candidatus Obscuribacterales bacterium]